jgi:hypothetical protein
MKVIVCLILLAFPIFSLRYESSTLEHLETECCPAGMTQNSLGDCVSICPEDWQDAGLICRREDYNRPEYAMQ